MTDNANGRPAPTLLPTSASAGVQRAVRNWLQTCTELPSDAGSLTYEDLRENETCICVAMMQAPAYVIRYIMGGYKAEYRFRVIYRVQPTDDGDMLDAVEALSAIGGWCETAAPPDLDGAVNEHVERTSDATILAAYEDGSNDYSIDLTLTWEVF